MTDTQTITDSRTSAMAPVAYRVRSRVAENRDSATLCLEPVAEVLATPLPGEFMMLYAFGVGEVAISVSGDPSITDGTITHTIRAVGAVSQALHDAQPGRVIGVRGPFGTSWGLAEAAARDLVIVAGGVGLAPLRPVLLGALADRAGFGKVTLIAGARQPSDFLFTDDLDRWSRNPSIGVHLTVDVPVQGWRGDVGFVTQPLRRLSLDPDRTTAFLCGPEPMMRFSAQALMDKGMADCDIGVSLERNMQCGIRWCRHCQLGPLLVCRDGPVVGYDVARPLLKVKEVVDAPTLAVWKFASCDGCQLTLLDCEDELLTLAEEVKIAVFAEASSAMVGGPYDVSLVEGSITTKHDEQRIREIRDQSRVLVSIGACATAGGVQALRNFADVAEFASVVYAKPEYIDTLATSTPASAHVTVDYQLPG